MYRAESYVTIKTDKNPCENTYVVCQNFSLTYLIIDEIKISNKTTTGLISFLRANSRLFNNTSSQADIMKVSPSSVRDDLLPS
jgi:hypothetical protein